jgi:hypothetical protein
VDYFNNGTIAPVVINEQGVGSYSAIKGFEAEHFHSLRGTTARKDHDETGRFGVYAISGDTVLEYRNVEGIPAHSVLVIRVANGADAPALVTVHADADDGVVLCAASVPPTDGWESYVMVPCKSAKPWPATAHLVLTFNCPRANNLVEAGDELLRLDHLIFQ